MLLFGKNTRGPVQRRSFGYTRDPGHAFGILVLSCGNSAKERLDVSRATIDGLIGATSQASRIAMSVVGPQGLLPLSKKL